MNTAPGAVFTALHFLSLKLTNETNNKYHITMAGKAYQGQHSSLLDPFMSYGENEVL